MLNNFPFINIGKHNQFDDERILLSTEIVRFLPNGETVQGHIVITKKKVFILTGDKIIRDIPINEIEAVTNSVSSFELILHLECSADERMSCIDKKKEIIQWVIHLQAAVGSPTLHHPSKMDNGFQMKVYIVPDLSLDIYVTTPEDIESGNITKIGRAHV